MLPSKWQVVADPTQPRRDWGSVAARQALEDLVASIKAFGILQPLLVRLDPEAPEDIQAEVEIRDTPYGFCRGTWRGHAADPEHFQRVQTMHYKINSI